MVRKESSPRYSGLVNIGSAFNDHAICRNAGSGPHQNDVGNPQLRSGTDSVSAPIRRPAVCGSRAASALMAPRACQMAGISSQ
jgi:hypothetical protein